MSSQENNHYKVFNTHSGSECAEKKNEMSNLEHIQELSLQPRFTTDAEYQNVVNICTKAIAALVTQ
jgi:hypothetical protein